MCGLFLIHTLQPSVVYILSAQQKSNESTEVILNSLGVTLKKIKMRYINFTMYYLIQCIHVLSFQCAVNMKIMNESAFFYFLLCL